MTSEQIERLDERVLMLQEAQVLLQQRVNLLEAQLAAMNAKLEMTTSMMASAELRSDRLIGIFDKVTGAKPTP
jgi:ABC-type uncharacterized transport system ATPase subunit